MAHRWTAILHSTRGRLLGVKRQQSEMVSCACLATFVFILYAAFTRGPAVVMFVHALSALVYVPTRARLSYPVYRVSFSYAGCFFLTAPNVERSRSMAKRARLAIRRWALTCASSRAWYEDARRVRVTRDWCAMWFVRRVRRVGGLWANARARGIP